LWLTVFFFFSWNRWDTILECDWSSDVCSSDLPDGRGEIVARQEQLFFSKKVVAQLLLSSADFPSPVRYKNLQNTLQELLQLGVVPVVNENDSVSVRELVGAFGDNDELSALLARAVKADWLVLLTDVDGFYTTTANGAAFCARSRDLRRRWKSC